MATFNKFNQFVQYVGQGVVNLNSDTLKVMLTNSAPSASNTIYSSISGTELANGNGYTTGGAAVTANAYTQTGGVGTLTGTLANPTWTATGAMGPFRYVVIYDSSAATQALIGWWDYGSAVNLTSTQTFTVSIASGVLTVQ